jgi:N-carbamoyl-L-amino-acid hydrolase
MEEAGLVVREDAIGNIFGRLQAVKPESPAIATGSHNDAIPFSGMYDGTVGVLGGLEALRAISQHLNITGKTLSKSIDLIMFTAEEPTRFGIGCLGSRLMAGTLTPEKAHLLRDAADESLEAIRNRTHYAGDLATVQLPKDFYDAFVELHIEQGPLLEQAGLQIGIVTAIAAPSSLRVKYGGPGGHAGAVLMKDRRDPIIPAAKLILEVQSAALEIGGDDTVATTGVVKVHPGAINSIPREVIVEMDIRDVDLERRSRVLARVEAAAYSFGKEASTPVTLEWINADPPATCASDIVDTIQGVCDAYEFTSQKMISRAYHDSLFMAQVCPTAMIFIPCRDGISHRPEEYASPEAIEVGVKTLASTLLSLAE